MRQFKMEQGFTLVEILIVVVILGILSAIVVPQFSTASEECVNTTFVTSLRAFVNAATIYQVKTGNFPADGSSGICPAGFEDYIDQICWERGTPLGGVWDSELNSFGYTSSIGVHFMNGSTRDDAYMAEVDAIFDDGNLSTGCFRKLAADRYYYIVR